MSQHPSGSSAEPAGRAEGLELLKVSASMDNTLVRPVGRAAEGEVVVMFVVRARRLTRAIFTLLDDDLAVEAEILMRALMETAVTFAWLGKDLSRRMERWQLDDHRWAIEQDDAAREAGSSTLSDAARARRIALRDGLLARRVKGMPDFRAMADSIDPSLYAGYKIASHGAIHATRFAMGRFFAQRTEEGATIHALAKPLFDEQYEDAALWLSVALDVAAVTTRRMPWTRGTLQPALDSITAGIEARKAIADGGA